MQFTITVRQKVVTRDGVSASIEAAVTFRASLLCLHRRAVVVRAVRSSLFPVVGKRELDDVLHGDDLGTAVLPS